MKTNETIEKKGFILAVDDVPHNLQVLGNILGTENYKIAAACNGKQALEILDKITPDLILLDVMMPELDGFETCRKLQEDPQTRDIPIIFLTARSDVVDIIMGFELGAVDYITKPFYGPELLARVKLHLELKWAREELQRKNRHLNDLKIQLGQAALTDPLTMLPNRRAAMEKLTREHSRFLRYQREFTLVLGDVDNFKMFNDKYGHQCGDFVLVSLARLMSEHLRGTDCVARWGGEEFLFLLPETGLEGGKTMAEKIREAVAGQVFYFNDLHLNITITFGVSVFDGKGGSSIDDKIKDVDLAMYEGKRQGKNRVVVAS
jgi:diguanylate cyclase (GGDEF)-like protein